MNLPPLLVSSQILENKEVFPGYYLITVDSPELAGRVIPGQFFDIRVTDRMDILLRRPLSIFDNDDTSVSMFYEVAGKGTALLSEKKPGEELDILGPLGNGYTLPMDADRVILVAGGIGVAPLYSWAKELIRIKKHGRKINIDVLVGAKDKHKILCEDYFNDIGLKPLIATDDGSNGYKGFVTDLLKKQISSIDIPSPNPLPYGGEEKKIFPLPFGERTCEARVRGTIIYACGPDVMLRNLSQILMANNIKGEISMERWMGCGMGACLGCVVKTNDGKYKRACKDGPIFKADEVLWE